MKKNSQKQEEHEDLERRENMKKRREAWVWQL